MKTPWPTIAALTLVGAIFFALWWITHITSTSGHFSQAQVTVLVLSGGGLALLAGLIGRQLFRLYRDLHHKRPGARLNRKLAGVFVLIAVLPMAPVYLFALQFMQQGINSWFSSNVDESLHQALAISQSVVDTQLQEARHKTQTITQNLAISTQPVNTTQLHKWLKTEQASELTLFDRQGQILATVSHGSTLLPDTLPPTHLITNQAAPDYIALETPPNDPMRIRVIMPLPKTHPATSPQRFLQAIYPVTGRANALARAVEQAFAGYQELNLLRHPLKITLTFLLSFASLVGLLSALWGALYAARRLIAPLSQLAEATHAVAAGRFDTQIPATNQDELGFLAQSFNEMTQKLAKATALARQSQYQEQQQRTYLTVVLNQLSSGVLTFDPQQCLVMCNPAAGRILVKPNLSTTHGRSLTELAHINDHLHPLWHSLLQHDPHQPFHMEHILQTPQGRKILLCQGQRFEQNPAVDSGYLLVVDDISALVQAERTAAWSEVARRLAHEIKNPLTPIHLAAERLRQKYLQHPPTPSMQVLDRATHTIIQQVNAMLVLVSAFNEYAKAPTPQLEDISINLIVQEVAELYRVNQVRAHLVLHLDTRNPHVFADRGRIRQLLHNLIKNALEALQQQPHPILTLTTQTRMDPPTVHIEVQDNGVGFEVSRQDIFEPYVTSKPKGSGLGLAIVRKIIEEHRGTIYAESPPEGGARFVVTLPQGQYIKEGNP